VRTLILITLISASLAAAASDYDRALDLYKHTDYQASLKVLQQLKEKDAAALALTGQNYFMLGDAKHATDFFQKAVAADPNNSVYYHWLGRAYGRRAETSNPFSALGHASKTHQSFEKAVELDPKNFEAINDLFEYYLEAPGFAGGGLDKATHIADRIAERDPAEGNYARARIAEKRKEYPSAEEHLRRAIQLAPRQVGRVIDLAKFLAKQGRFQESDETFVAAEKLAPDAPKVMYARAATYIQAGRNLDTARVLLEKYLASSLTPEDPPRSEARKLLERVSGG
jgi:tetratricopeptide (TPR) repeat protein